MNADEVSDALRDAIKSERASVIGITGDWGVGKTYLWKEFVIAEKDSIAAQYPKYAYVSLFGLTSSSEVKTNILEKLARTADVTRDVRATLENALEVANKRKKSIGVSLAKRIQAAVGSVGSVGRGASEVMQGIFDAIEFATVRKALICLDDLERISPPLTSVQVMGLIDVLARERECKVFVIHSPENIQDEKERESLRVYREKLFDREIHFDPPTDYAVTAAAAGSNDLVKQTLAKGSERLNLKNIRIMRRVVDAFSDLVANAPEMRPELAEQLFTSLLLLSYCTFVRKDDVPTVDEVMEVEFVSVADLKKNKADARKETTLLFLKNYGWTHRDEFDVKLAGYVQRGTCDWDALSAMINAANEEHSVFFRRKIIEDLWNEYRGRFMTNAQWDEFSRRMRLAYLENMAIVVTQSIDNALFVLREAGKPAIAAEILNGWKEKHGGDLKMLDLARIEEFEKLYAEDLREFCQQRFVAIPKPAKNVREILESIGNDKGLGQDDLGYLSAAEVAQYAEAMRAMDFRVVRTALKSIEGAGDHYAPVKKKLTDALKMVASDSPVNKLKVVKNLKIDVDA